jgi:probable rRNA maturation factor
MEIHLTNQQYVLDIDSPRLVRAARQVLTDAGIVDGSLSIAVVDDAAIHEVNRVHLNHDFATDVLSFLLEEGDGSLVGEVIVSAETALQRCEEFDQSPHDELLLYVLHGTLHLVGYNDKSDSEAAEMRAAEAEYLRQYCSTSDEAFTTIPQNGESPT